MITLEYAPDHVGKCSGRWGVRETLNEGGTRIAGGDDLWIDGNSPKERNVHLLSECLSAAGFEDIDFPTTVRTEEPAHVLDDSDYRQ